MTPVGFEPTHPKIVELESTALDRSAKVSISVHMKPTIFGKRTRLWQCEHANRFGRDSAKARWRSLVLRTSQHQCSSGGIQDCHRYGPGSVPSWLIFCSAGITTIGHQRFMRLCLAWCDRSEEYPGHNIFIHLLSRPCQKTH